MVEAIAEDLKIKTTLFENLDEICKPGAILATTTSSLPIIQCAQATNRPAGRRRDALLQPGADHEAGRGRLDGLAPPRTSPRPRRRCARKVGKVAVSCGDRAGFIVNALLFPYLNDAIKMLEAHYATADDIDTAMKQGCALPMGPFELLDVVGNDVSLAIQRELYLEFREPGFAPGAAARAPGHRGLPRSQDQARVPRLQLALTLRPAQRWATRIGRSLSPWDVVDLPRPAGHRRRGRRAPSSRATSARRSSARRPSSSRCASSPSRTSPPSARSCSVLDADLAGTSSSRASTPTTSARWTPTSRPRPAADTITEPEHVKARHRDPRGRPLRHGLRPRPGRRRAAARPVARRASSTRATACRSRTSPTHRRVAPERDVPACALDAERVRAGAEPDIRKVMVGSTAGCRTGRAVAPTSPTPPATSAASGRWT